MSPQGWKMHKKKRDLPLHLKGPWRGLGAKTPPPAVWTFGAKLKNSTLHSKKFQHKPSSSTSLWAQKQASDSKFQLTLWCKTLHPHTIKSKFQLKLCSSLTMRPCKQATDSNIELTLWCKTQHPHTIESKFQLKLCSSLTMWPCKQATNSNFELTLWCKTQHPHTQ
jgi:hypothetical protein